MEKNMENEMETLGPFKGVYRDLEFEGLEVQGLGFEGFRV